MACGAFRTFPREIEIVRPVRSFFRFYLGNILILSLNYNILSPWTASTSLDQAFASYISLNSGPDVVGRHFQTV